MAGPYRNGPPPEARNPESRMIAEYAREKFPTYRTMLRVQLGGPVPGTERLGDLTAQLRASRPWRPEVDAVVVFGDVLLLVEAKMNEALLGLGKLPFYGSLVTKTPELAPYHGLEVRLRLVVPRAFDWVRDAAAAHNVEVDVYWRDWMGTYFDWREYSMSRQGRADRQARREAIARLGL